MASKINELELTFKCPAEHGMKIHFTNIQTHGNYREIDEFQFHLTCPICVWSGIIMGRCRVDLKEWKNSEATKA